MDVREKQSSEKRLIDADALWRKFESEPWYDNADRDEIALPLVDEAQTVDAVPVSELKKLRDYTVKHFTDEENYMESIHYKKIFTQKIQHQEFITKLDKFIEEHENETEDQDEQIMSILNYLTDWLVNHILHVDGQIPKE